MRCPDPHRRTMRAARLRPLALVCAILAVAGCAARPSGEPVRTPQSTTLQAADTLTLVLMGTTDVHGRLYDHDYYTDRPTDHGLALLKPLIDSIRAAHPDRTMLFDSGDLLQGNPLALVYARQYGTQPSPIIRAMNLLGYDAAAIGNHEFNYGLDHLGNAISQARFPFVSANIFRAGSDQHAYAPYTLLPIVTPAGDTLLVGVTGNTPPGVHLWDRDNVSGVLEFRDVFRSVRNTVAELKARGADVVIVLSHGGLDGTSYDTLTTGLPAENVAAQLARETPGIDVIFLGHTHRELADTVIGDVLLTQAANWASSLALATLSLRRHADGDWRVDRKHAGIVRPRPGSAPRAFLDSLRWEHERTVAYVNQTVGTAAERLDAREARVRDTPIIDFINEVQRRAAGADLSATAAFRLDAGLPVGDIRVADIASLYPYENTLKAIRITGAQLRAYLEKSAEYYNVYAPDRGGTVTNTGMPGYNFDIVSGVDYVLDLSRPVGNRVVVLEKDGLPVADDRTFTLALNNYRQAGGGGYGVIAGAPVVHDRQEDIRELLIAEVRARGTVRAQDYFTENWRIVPAAAADAALAEQSAHEHHAGAAQPDAERADNAQRKRLRVLSTNDFHGNLAPVRGADGVRVGGAAALAAYFRLEADAFDGPTLLLDGGDIMQGTSLSNLVFGRTSVEYYNAVGYDAAAIGNHEFDWGTAVLRERIADARFPWLAANIVVTGSDTIPSWLGDTVLIERDGVRVGIIGLTTQSTPQATLADHVRGLTFLDGAETMDRMVPRMRAAGADFVIVVAHAGTRCDTPEGGHCDHEMVDWLARATHRPDLVVGGHTEPVIRTRLSGVPLVQTGSFGRTYGVIDLERVSADSVDVWIRGTPVPWTDRVAPDSAIAALVARAEEAVGPQLMRVMAHVAEEMPRAVGGQLIADAQRAATGARIAIMNLGGVRAPFPAGPVTWGDLFRIQPFGNTLHVLKLTGNQLRRAVEHAVASRGLIAQVSGIAATWDSRREPGDRIVSIALDDGTPIHPDSTYTVAVNNFLANGIGDGFVPLGEALENTPTGIVDLDALIQYLQSLPEPVRAPVNLGLRRIDTP